MEPPIIQDDGDPFEPPYIEKIRRLLESLSDDQRRAFQRSNSAGIAQHAARHMVIVSGPGTGKSFLFLARIKHWHEGDDQATVTVSTFVRKLANDLIRDIDSDVELSDERKARTQVHTLHKLARSIVERNHGTRQWPFEPHVRIIGQDWKQIVWDDVLSFHPSQELAWEEFEHTMHSDVLWTSSEVKPLAATYFTLCRFYNASGFADLILRARDAVAENVSLVEPSYFIIDEYQDFNETEEQFIDGLLGSAKGTLVVGDDDQTLYEALKLSVPDLIRGRYNDAALVNAMLPFCGRCQHHIAGTAAHFMERNADADRVPRVFLPVKRDPDADKVQVIACAHPNSAADYIAAWMERHRAEIETRASALAEGQETEPSLLILSPAGKIEEFYRTKLAKLLDQFTTVGGKPSDDYYKVATYYSVAERPENNFSLRKVLFHEGVEQKQTHGLLAVAIERGVRLCELDDPAINEALAKCHRVKEVIDATTDIATATTALAELITISDTASLHRDMSRRPIGKHVDEVEEEQSEKDVSGQDHLSAVELMSVVGAKGLSADHVIVVGCDNINMAKLSPKAFYVALTRGRKSLHLLTALQLRGARDAHHFIDDLPDEHVEFGKYTKKDGGTKPVKGRLGFHGFIKGCNSTRGGSPKPASEQALPRKRP